MSSIRQNKPFKVVRQETDVPVLDKERQLLSEVGAEMVSVHDVSPEVFVPAVEDADAIIASNVKINREMMSHLEKCRVIARQGIGVDYIDIDAATDNGILVTNVPGFCAIEAADHTMALLLALSRKLFVMYNMAKSGRMNARSEVRLERLAGKKLGLVGFGHIARAVAKRAKAFELMVYAYDPYVTQEIMQAEGVKPLSLPELVRTCDIVSLHTPLTKETRHMIGEKELRMMKRNALLINTARGAVVDEDALLRALKEERIAGAGLDVFYKLLDPFTVTNKPVDSPLFSLDNVVLTPHVAATSIEARQTVVLGAAREVCRVLQGLWPKNPVNPSVMPRYPLKGQRDERAV